MSFVLEHPVSWHSCCFKYISLSCLFWHTLYYDAPCREPQPSSSRAWARFLDRPSCNSSSFSFSSSSWPWKGKKKENKIKHKTQLNFLLPLILKFFFFFLLSYHLPSLWSVVKLCFCFSSVKYQYLVNCLTHTHWNFVDKYHLMV